MINGNKIKRIREIKGLTQEDIAKKLNLTHQAYSRMERGETSISIERIAKIAEILDVTVDDIYRMDEKKVLILEKMIKSQQDEINHLRRQVEKLTDLLFGEKKK